MNGLLLLSNYVKTSPCHSNTKHFHANNYFSIADLGLLGAKVVILYTRVIDFLFSYLGCYSHQNDKLLNAMHTSK